MRKINFFLPGNPPTVTHQEKKIRVAKGKPIVYEPYELKKARKSLEEQLYKFKPEEPAEGAIHLLVKWLFPIPRTTKHYDGEYKTTKPDTDNLNKLLKDVMTDLKFWKDDAQVASEVIQKFYANTPGIFIYIEEINSEESD